MNKKNIIIWSIFIFAVLLSSAVMYYFFFVLDDSKSWATNKNGQKEISPILVDQENFAEAVKNNDISLCSKVKDESISKVCESTLVDIGYYNEALKQFDTKICEKITEKEREEACLTITKKGIAYLESNDPVYLADVHAIAHNESVITEYENLLKKDSKQFDILLSLSLAYAEKALKDQEGGGNQEAYLKKASETLEKAKSINAQNSEVYRVEGYINEIVPNYPKAIELYDKAIKLDDKSILAYSGRGHVYNMMGALDKALEDFTQAAKFDLEKNVSSIYSNLCRLASSKSDLTKLALENCKTVINMKNAGPNDKSQAYQIIARLQIQDKQYDQAEKSLQSSKIINPNDPNLYVSFANLYLEMKKPEQALVEANNALIISPNKVAAYYYSSKANYMLGDFDKSIEASENGLKYLDEDVSLLTPYKSSYGKDLYYMLANAYDKKGDSQKAVKYVAMGDEMFKTE